MSESLIDRRADLSPGKSRDATGERGSAAERTLSWLHDSVIDEIWRRYGARSLREFVVGVLEYAALADAHHKDLTSQLTWLDADRKYQEKARRLQSAITEHNIPVELDTFVESWEECSTAHVHDDDRLVVIEQGEMEFWNCFGEMHKFAPGDAMYVPMHRLHGSVVMSGTCVYHQPVITPEINEQYG
jgi:mannose-6-phosphate isomerase-like protein (cupin superfamily)